MGTPSTNTPPRPPGNAERRIEPQLRAEPTVAEQLRFIPTTRLLELRDSAEFRGMCGGARTAPIRTGEATVDQLSDEIERRVGIGPLAAAAAGAQ